MKQRFARDQALAVAERIVDELRPACSRIQIAGSLRRGRPDVGDVEIVYVSLTAERPVAGNMFATIDVSLADERIAALEASGVFTRRLNKLGRQTYGPLNKAMVHRASGIPVDLFATREECWWNYLVCRTGGAINNEMICAAAIARGWHWAPYASGFKTDDGRLQAVSSEEEVYAFVGLPYRDPEERT
jgi:DNA polymerase/3'-5' exonuclease PolX